MVLPGGDSTRHRQPVCPLGGDHGKRTLTGLGKHWFFSGAVGALCHFFHERYQRNFCVGASPSNMKVQLAPTRGQSPQVPEGPASEGSASGKGSSEGDYAGLLLFVTLCCWHFRRAKWWFFSLCFFSSMFFACSEMEGLLCCCFLIPFFKY